MDESTDAALMRAGHKIGLLLIDRAKLQAELTSLSAERATLRAGFLAALKWTRYDVEEEVRATSMSALSSDYNGEYLNDRADMRAALLESEK